MKEQEWERGEQRETEFSTIERGIEKKEKRVGHEEWGGTWDKLKRPTFVLEPLYKKKEYTSSGQTEGWDIFGLNVGNFDNCYYNGLISFFS